MFLCGEGLNSAGGFLELFWRSYDDVSQAAMNQ